MRMKLIGALAMVALIAACSDKDSGMAGNTGDEFNGARTAGTPTGATPGTEQDLVQNVGDRVMFETNHSDLTADARATLDRQATWLKKYANLTVTVEGHCDERGTREFNLALGERRADAVKKYLIASGIPVSSRSDDQLWQGTSCSYRQRRVGMVAEPPRRDGGELSL